MLLYHKLKQECSAKFHYSRFLYFSWDVTSGQTPLAWAVLGGNIILMNAGLVASWWQYRVWTFGWHPSISAKYEGGQAETPASNVFTVSLRYKPTGNRTQLTSFSSACSTHSIIMWSQFKHECYVLEIWNTFLCWR